MVVCSGGHESVEDGFGVGWWNVRGIRDRKMLRISTGIRRRSQNGVNGYQDEMAGAVYEKETLLFCCDYMNETYEIQKSTWCRVLYDIYFST